ncbi:MAG: response regulator transcription factor [Acidobacteriota bacterium]
MNGRKYRVVLVDDDDHIRLLWKMLVESVNCEVVGEGRDGYEAVSLYRKSLPDLMLLDLNMPNRSGEEALRDVRFEFPDARVVVLTAKAQSESVMRCIKSGAVGYILKDTPLAKLKVVISEMLAKGDAKP